MSRKSVTPKLSETQKTILLRITKRRDSSQHLVRRVKIVVDGPNRRLGDHDLVSVTGTGRFHALSNEADHLGDHRNEVQNLGDLDPHRLELFAATCATAFLRVQRNMGIAARYLRRKRLATTAAVFVTFWFRLT